MYGMSPRRRSTKSRSSTAWRRKATAAQSRSTTSSRLSWAAQTTIANLYPEKANAHPGYHVKDKLENKLHQLVFASQLSLSSVRHQIASDWQALYKRVFGTARRDERAR